MSKHDGVDKKTQACLNAHMEALNEAIQRAGGVGKLAEAIGTKSSVVSNWRQRKTLPPPEYCPAIEQITGVTRRDLRPDDWERIWPELADKAAA